MTGAVSNLTILRRNWAEYSDPATTHVVRVAGVPIGGELDYLDDGTITAALNARRKV